MTPATTKRTRRGAKAARNENRARRSPTNSRKAGEFTSAELERIAERVFKLSEADETEVEIDATTEALTRFANNVIHQNVAEKTVSISVRAVVDGRTARATTNKTDDDSLRRAAATAVSLARNEPKIPDLLPMLRAQKYEKVARYLPRPPKRRRRIAHAR